MSGAGFALFLLSGWEESYCPLLVTRLDYGYNVFSGLSFPIVCFFSLSFYPYSTRGNFVVLYGCVGVTVFATTSVGGRAVPTRDVDILTVGGKRVRFAEGLFQTGFSGTRVSGFYDTSLQSNMKCDVYIRKELYAMLCSQVAQQGVRFRTPLPLVLVSSYKHFNCAEMLFTVGAKRLHCAEDLSSPRRTSSQPGTFHDLHQTLPFRGTLTQHETGTSSLLAPNASLAQKSRSCQVPPVRGQRIPQHFSPEPLLHNGVVRVFRAISASTVDIFHGGIHRVFHAVST